MSSIIEFGGWIFWTIIAIWFLYLIIAIESKNDEVNLGRTLLATLILAAFFYFSLGKEFKMFFTSTPLSWWLIMSGLYLVAGLVWSFARWIMFVKNKLKKAKYEYSNYQNKNDLILKTMPKAGDNKAKISGWLIFWPFSLLRYVIGDLLTDLVDSIVTAFSGLYNRLSHRIYRSVMGPEITEATKGKDD